MRLAIWIVGLALLTTAGVAQARAGSTPPAGPQVTQHALGIASAGDIVVDPNTGNVYVPAPAANEVLVRDSGGAAVATVSITDPTGVAIDPGNGRVWVSEGSQDALTSFDPTTFAVGSPHSLGATAACPGALDPTGTVIWVAFTCGGVFTAGVAAIDPSTDTVTPPLTSISGPLRFAPSSDPDTLYAGSRFGVVYSLDVSQPGVGATVTKSVSPSTCSDVNALVWNATAAELVLACSGVQSSAIRMDAGLNTIGSYAAPPNPVGAAISPDGGHVAVGSDTGSGTDSDVQVYSAGATSPVEEIASSDPQHVSMLRDGLAWNGSRLYVLHSDILPTSVELAVVTNPTVPDGQVTVQAPAQATARSPFQISGSLSISDGGSAGLVDLSVTRTNPDTSVTALPDVATASNGDFSFQDVPPAAGATTYTVTYPGDASHDG